MRQSTPQGIESLKNALAIRISHNCAKYLEALDRMQEESLDFDMVVWHKGCFSSFTSKEHLQRLKKRSATVVTPDTEVRPQPTTTRRSVDIMQWEKCIFCQENTSDSLHQILTLPTSKKVMERAMQVDPILSYRVAGVSDLVAPEAKYHLKCYVHFSRKVDKLGAENVSGAVFDPVCLHEVMKELDVELKAGNIFSIKSVWNRYIELLSSNDSACSLEQERY